MSGTASERSLILLLRLSLAWVFLYAASHQVLVPGWSVSSFLGTSKTFHGFFALFAAPAVAPTISFLVEYGHLLIGLSLLAGLLVRVSSIAAIGLMVLYWMAHLDFPYVSDTTNFLVDEHVIDALVLGLLIASRAGQVWGLDGWLARQAVAQRNPLLGWAAGA